MTHNLSSDINVILEKRIIKFIYNALNNNHVCKHLLEIKLRCKNSSFADNYKYISYKYQLCHSDWKKDQSHLMGKVKKKIDILYPKSSVASIITELSDMRDNHFYDVLSHDELISLIDELCIN